MGWEFAMKYFNKKILLAWIFQLSVLVSVKADPLDNWTTNQISSTNGLYHVVYGTNCYVAVGQQGDYGAIYSSANGTDWTLRHIDLNLWGLSLTYSAGRFVGSGNWETAVSADGTNWSVLFVPGQYRVDGSTGADMTYGNNIYVSVGTTNGVGFIMTSPDTITWTTRTSTPAPGGQISSVAFGNTKFVAVGNNDGLVYVSGNGSTWTRSSIAGGNKISYCNGLFLVPLTVNSNLISTDGINWNPQSTGLTNQLGTIIYSHGLFLGASGRHLATSTDGTNWFQYSQPFPSSYRMTNFDNTFDTDGSRLVAVDYGPNFPPVAEYGYAYISGPVVGVQIDNSSTRGIALAGLVGRNYQIQSIGALATGTGTWTTNATVQLTNTPYIWTDTAAPSSARFYRGVLLP